MHFCYYRVDKKKRWTLPVRWEHRCKEQKSVVSLCPIEGTLSESWINLVCILHPHLKGMRNASLCRTHFIVTAIIILNLMKYG